MGIATRRSRASFAFQMSEEAPLLRVCSLLNNCKAQYLIVGLTRLTFPVFDRVENE